jgi:hypothetical protein
MICKICAGTAISMSCALILGRFKVEFFHCPACGFVQTETPFWLEEAYSETIAASDVGLVSRNLRASHISRSIIHAFFNPAARFLDWGGGCGLFVRLMRNAGLDFYWYDAYSPNLFAKGVEVNLEKRPTFELITAFEVFEHLKNPLDDIRIMLNLSRNIFFSTHLITEKQAPHFDKWWYYDLDNGQHIAFFSLKTLKRIAQIFGLRLYSNCKNFHLLTDRRLPAIFVKLMLKSRFAVLFGLFCRRTSLTIQDYQHQTKKIVKDIQNVENHL